ncbi:MAG TPA: 50S ribosomal protein L18 [Candidatus Sulfotelmatobacter sp.]|jgi:large subunit ribosomal protein L18|nr:50S ribosomal protein L18 [Candidatus Sulfotelmatobacter sp.]
MASNARYRVQLRRRREGKTDYQARKALVVSGNLRLVARNSLKNASAQIIIAKPNGDEVLAAAHSNELKEFGWQAATGNIPAAYLTGLLCGLRAKKVGIEEAVLDIGLIPPTKGSRVFALLSGVVDAGVEVPYNEEKLVKERTNGSHIAEYAKELGSGSEDYSDKFSAYLSQNLAPEKLPDHFVQVKNTIINSFKSEGKKQ